MRRTWILLAILVTACQPPASAITAKSPAPAPLRSNVFYVADGPQMLEMDWSGKVVGAVSAKGFAGPSADGSRYLRYTGQLIAEDSSGGLLGPLAADPDTYGTAMWADDGRQVCGVIVPPNAGPDAGQDSLWIGAPGEAGRTVGPVGKPGAASAVAACSIKNNRAVIVGGLFPHWPPQAERHLITTNIQVVDLATGAVEYDNSYASGYPASGSTPNWVLVAASPDARYVAESGVFSNAAVIREMPSGKAIASISGAVSGFSWDGTQVVATVTSAGSTEAQVIRWADKQISWHQRGVAQSVLAKPNSTDLLLSIANQGSAQLFALTDVGTNVLLRDATVSWPCPCPPGV